jgi:hypothetical protein
VVPPRGRGGCGRRHAIVVGMAQMIVAFLGTAAWVAGVLLLVVMAAIPFLEGLADPDHR